MKEWRSLAILCPALILLISSSGFSEPVYSYPAARVEHAPIISGTFLAEDWATATAIRTTGATYRIEFDENYLFLRGVFDKPGETDLSLGGSSVRVSNNPQVLARSEGQTLTARVPWTAFGKAKNMERVRVEIGHSGAATVRFIWTGLNRPKQILTLLPYALAGATEGRSTLADTGLDAKMSFKKMKAWASINPDFRTVEKDILSLDFSYFERLPAETRSFFNTGSSYFDSAYFASQRIDTFDGAAKAYGNLDEKTKLGIFDGATFYSQNYLVGSLTHQMDADGVFSAGFKSFHNAGLANDFMSAGVNYKLGDFRVLSNLQMTRDNEVGGGDTLSTSLLYGRNGFFGRITGVETDPNFLDRLGYYTEPDVKGIDASLGKSQAFSAGAISRASASLYTSQYRYLNDDPYRNYYGGGGSVSFRNNADLTMNFTTGTFLSNKDHIVEVIGSTPGLGPKSRLGFDVTTGQLASSGYTSVLVFATLNPTPRWHIWGSIQAVHQFDDQEQGILHADYDLLHGQSIGGRLVQLGHDWSGYVRYRKALSGGGEFQALFGDPNTPRFQREIILKVILPFEVKF